MGQHKHNPNVKLAKEGKLPPRGEKVGAPERRRWLEEIVFVKMHEIMHNHQVKSAKKEFGEEK